MLCSIIVAPDNRDVYPQSLLIFSLKAKSASHNRALSGICLLFKLVCGYSGPILAGVHGSYAGRRSGGREMVLRNTSLSKKKEPRNETEAFSFPSSLLWTLSLKIDT